MKKTRTRILEDMLISREKIKTDSNSLRLENSSEGLRASISCIESNKLEQELRQGHNKARYDKDTQNFNDVLFTHESDGSITASGTSSQYSMYYLSDVFETLEVSEYTLAVMYDKKATGDVHFDIRDNSNTLIEKLHLTDVENAWHIITFSVEEVKSVRPAFYITNGKEVNMNLKFMLVKGSYTVETLPNYEAYGQCPSKKFPSEIEGVSGAMKLKVRSKNFLNFTNTFQNIRYNKPSKTRIESNIIDIKESLINNNKDIIISTNLNLSIYRWAINICNYPEIPKSENNGLDSGWIGRNTYILKKDFLKNRPKNILIVISKVDDSNIDAEEINNNYYFQVEYEKVATGYQKHKEQNFTISLGNKTLYRGDKIVRKNRKWYFYNRYDKRKITSVDQISKNEYGTNAYAINIPDIDNLDGSAINIISNMFFGVSYDDRTMDKENIIYVNSVNKNIVFRNTEFETIESFKQFLNENDVYIVYKLMNSEWQEIVGEELIKELDAILLNLYEYDDITNFDFDNAVTFEIEVEKDNLKIINSRLDEIEKQNLITSALALEEEV